MGYLSNFYRCGSSGCRRRVALSRHRERIPACKHCGGELHYDAYTSNKRSVTCHCDGVSYPHRVASTVWCREHLTGPTDEDYKNRYTRG